jgi:D-alanyl-D-alanine carboxypeptidase
VWKYWFSYVTSLFLGTILFLLILSVFHPTILPLQKAVSPVPAYLSLQDNKQVEFLDLWTPIIQTIYGEDTPKTLNLTAKSVLMYDLTTNKTLYTENPDARLPMASLTKIMTAIIALENKKSDDRYLVTSEDVVGEDSMGVSSGEVFTRKDLLYGLLLPSGNDAAETFASNYPGGRTAFTEAMNEKAQALGMLDTHYTNPSGLQGDGDQYTTAYDLLLVTRYALENFPDFAKAVSTYEYDIPTTQDHKAFQLFNETNLLTTYAGVEGVKTGYTPDAGYCLITYLHYKGHNIIGVLLGSQNRRQEMKDLLDYSLEELQISPPLFPK